MLIQLLLALGVPTSEGQWPQELAVPTVAEFAQGVRHIKGDALYNRRGMVINLFQGVTYDEAVRTTIKTMIGLSSLPSRLRPNSQLTHLNANFRSNGTFWMSVSYGDTNAGTVTVSINRKETAADAEEWMARPAPAVAVLAVRRRHLGVDIGDDHFFLHGLTTASSMVFQVGRYIVDVYGAIAEKTLTDSQFLDIGRAVEFRLYKNGLVGDHGEEFTLNDGRKVHGVRSPHKYVPLKNLEKLGITVTSYTDAEPRYAIIKRGNKTAKVTEFAMSLDDNGEAKTCPPAIPFDGDLWVPLTETLRALGLVD